MFTGGNKAPLSMAQVGDIPLDANQIEISFFATDFDDEFSVSIGNAIVDMSYEADTMSSTIPFKGRGDISAFAGTQRELKLELNGQTAQSFVVISGIQFVGGAGLPGDYNGNFVVDAADYVVWRKNLGGGTSLPNDDTPGVGPDDYQHWRARFGNTAGGDAILQSAEPLSVPIPEPASMFLLIIGSVICNQNRRQFIRVPAKYTGQGFCRSRSPHHSRSAGP
jgi:hypothetical protein